MTGANVENAAYPVGTCAERVAIATAVTQHVSHILTSTVYQKNDDVLTLTTRELKQATSAPSQLPPTFRRRPALVACADSSSASSAR